MYRTFRAKDQPRDSADGARFGFVLGFGALNALIWLGGCAMTINDMSFH